MTIPLVNNLRLPSTLRALRHRNYLLFISGQAVSLTGGWIQGTAQGWLVYRLTSDPSMLGWVSFASQAPVLALGLIAGIVSDSVNRLRLIILMQLLAMGQALVLALLTLLYGANGQPLIQIWHILLLATFAGVLQAFDLPARQAFLMQLVPREDLGNAVALNSLTFNAARIIGPSIAGGMIAILQRLNPGREAFGEGMCFAVNTLSFFGVLIQLHRMRMPPGALRPFRGTSKGFLVEGLRYIGKHRHIRYILEHAGYMALFGLPYLVMIPVFAKDVLAGNSTTYGWLMTSIGAGALAGGVGMAKREQIRGIGTLIGTATAGFAVLVIIFSWLKIMALACVTLALAGFCMVSVMIGVQTVIQTLVSEGFRGRVMAYYSMVAVGLMPFGSLAIGASIKAFGPEWGMTINGVICLGVAALFFWRLPGIRAAARATPEYHRAVRRADTNA
ncbi:MAG: MFS transporter [bacterium]|nr:MFS transporter [Candidatus Sumerlaeota bacterium]